MNEWLKRIREQLTGLWSRWNRTQKVVLFSIIGASILAIILLISLSATPAMVPLISSPVADADARLQIAAKLDEMQVKYQLRARQRVLRCRRADRAARPRGAEPGEPHPQGDRPVGAVRHGAVDHHRLRARRQPAAGRHPAAGAAHHGPGRRRQRQRDPGGAQDGDVPGGPEAHQRVDHHVPETRIGFRHQPQEGGGRAASHQDGGGGPPGREHRDHRPERHADQRLRRPGRGGPAGARQAGAEAEAASGAASTPPRSPTRWPISSAPTGCGSSRSTSSWT